MKTPILLSLFMMISICSFAQNNWVKGTWTGEGYQYDTKSTWTIKLTVSEKYLIEYPSIPCGGEWIVTTSKTRKIEVKENITDNLELCVNNSSVIIKKKGRNKLTLTYFEPGSKKKGAVAVLKRQPSA